MANEKYLGYLFEPKLLESFRFAKTLLSAILI
jgi:hypothetical protein